MFFEIIKFIVYSSSIVLLSKYILVVYIRKLAENLELRPKTIGDIAGISTSVPELLTITTSSLRGLPRSKHIQYFKFQYNKFNSIFSCYNYK